MTQLQLVVSSLAPFAVPGGLQVIGRALDVDERFRPSRLDQRDPPHARISSVEDALAGYEHLLMEPKAQDPYLYVVMDRDVTPVLTGDVEAGDRDAAELAGWQRERARNLVPSGVSVTLEREDELRDDLELLDGLQDLLVRLCEATDAYTGTVSFEGAVERQMRDLLLATKSGPRGDPLPIGANVWERELRRPGWLTYLGPGYVEFFGTEVLARLGVGRVWTANGGVVVRATDTPFVFEPMARATSDYPFVREWLDVVGPDVFAHESQVPGAPGEHVPLMAAHVGHARSPGTDAFTRVGSWARVRPLAPVAAAPNETPPASDRAIAAVSALRQLGFFAGWAGGDAAVAAELEQARRAATGTGFEADDDAWLELELAAEDRARVWWQDAEADVAPGARTYERVVEQWAGISRGCFVPVQVHETWEGDEGPVNVDVEAVGGHVTLRLRRLDDFLDVDALLVQFNELVTRHAMRFVQVDTRDQTAYIVVVDADEQAALGRRGWRFHPLALDDVPR